MSAVNVYFTRPELNARWDPMEFNFEGLEVQKLHIPTDRAQRVDEKCYVFSQSYGL